jgi:hypothetical protein
MALALLGRAIQGQVVLGSHCEAKRQHCGGVDSAGILRPKQQTTQYCALQGRLRSLQLRRFEGVTLFAGDGHSAESG